MVFYLSKSKFELSIVTHSYLYIILNFEFSARPSDSVLFTEGGGDYKGTGPPNEKKNKKFLTNV